MAYLLDTHAFLWFIDDDKQLSEYACHTIQTAEKVYVSMASIWEIAIKYKLGKLTLSSDFNQFIPHHIKVNNFEILPIDYDHVATTISLDFFHKYPFDRLIIAQAIHENLTLISKDTHFVHYPVALLW